MTLCGSDIFEPALMAEAELQILNSIPGEIEDYLEVQFHVGTGSASARLAMLENTAMTGGQKQLVQLRFAAPLPLVPGERFVVRANVADAGVSGMTTIGGGQILGLSNARLRRKKPWTLALLAARREAVNDPLRWCELMVRESQSPATCCRPAKNILEPPGGNRRRARTSASRKEDIPRARRRMVAWQKPARNGGKNSPRRPDFPHLQSATRRHQPRRTPGGAQFQSCPSGGCGGITAGFKTTRTQRRLVPKAGWSARIPDSDQRLCHQIAAALRQAGFAPPSLAELAAAVGEPLPRAAAMARLLAERGIVARLDDQIWMHRDAVEAGKQAALKLFARAPAFTTWSFADALGVSRKFAVPLVDYLDKIRFTVRSGNTRTPGVEAKKVLT